MLFRVIIIFIVDNNTILQKQIEILKERLRAICESWLSSQRKLGFRIFYDGVFGDDGIFGDDDLDGDCEESCND